MRAPLVYRFPPLQRRKGYRHISHSWRNNSLPCRNPTQIQVTLHLFPMYTAYAHTLVHEVFTDIHVFCISAAEKLQDRTREREDLSRTLEVSKQTAEEERARMLVEIGKRIFQHSTLPCIITANHNNKIPFHFTSHVPSTLRSTAAEAERGSPTHRAAQFHSDFTREKDVGQRFIVVCLGLCLQPLSYAHAHTHRSERNHSQANFSRWPCSRLKSRKFYCPRKDNFSRRSRVLDRRTRSTGH